MSHFIEKCRECGTTISQCRCPDLNKTVKYGICAKCKETPPDRAMTRAEVEAIPERTALGWDDIANLKAHTLALHDKLDRAMQVIQNTVDDFPKWVEVNIDEMKALLAEIGEEGSHDHKRN